MSSSHTLLRARSPRVSFSISVLQRCKQLSSTDSSSSVMCLGAGCMGRSGGTRDWVKGLWITDREGTAGGVLGSSDDGAAGCSVALREGGSREQRQPSGSGQRAEDPAFNSRMPSTRRGLGKRRDEQ